MKTCQVGGAVVTAYIKAEGWKKREKRKGGKKRRELPEINTAAISGG